MSNQQYQEIYQAWKDAPEAFWQQQASLIDWSTPPQTIFERNATGDRWYVDGEMNTCYNCVDRHVEAGHGDRDALIYDSPMTNRLEKLSYAALQERVECVAGMLQSHNIGKGDRVIIYMPMIAETAIASLACARLGAIHSIVFGGFAATELATRIDDARPKMILAASCGLEPGRVIAYKPLIDAAVQQAAHKPEHIIVLQREQGIAELSNPCDVDWKTQEEAARAAGGSSEPPEP